MGELSKLPGIGKVVEEQLNQAGITTEEQLRSIGSRQAWLKIREFDETACMHRLLALEGAIQGVKKAQLPEATKKDLREFFTSVRNSCL